MHLFVARVLLITVAFQMGLQVHGADLVFSPTAYLSVSTHKSEEKSHQHSHPKTTFVYLVFFLLQPLGLQFHYTPFS